MSVSHSIRIAAPPPVVFALYENVASWPAWDHETLAVSLPNLRAGASGWLKPRNGPKARIVVAALVPDVSFTIESRLPLCQILFGHDLTEEAGQTIATHWVRFTGPLAFLFRRLIGAGIDRTLPTTLQGLKAAAEGMASPR